MRFTLFALPFILATDLVAQAPHCAEAALAAAPDVWDAAAAVTGDLTLDGKTDVAFWKRDGESVFLYIVACDGDRAVETWRFRIPAASTDASGQNPVQLTSPLLDAALVDRVCSGGNADECAHMHAENQRRQAIADAGGRELRIGSTGDTAIRLRWSSAGHGFMRVGG